MVSTDWAALRAQAETEGGTKQEIIPAGTYLLEVIKASYNVNAKSKEQIKLQFKVIGGVHDDFKGVFSTLTLSPESAKAVQIMLRQLEALGAKALMDAGKSLEDIAPTLVGVQVEATTEVGSWKDEPTVDVKNLKAVGLDDALPEAPAVEPSTEGEAVRPPF